MKKITRYRKIKPTTYQHFNSAIILVLTISSIISVNAQDTLQGLQPMRFYHTNGIISSEGFVRNGKPDGYWKTYDEQGSLRSEGNRRNFELDGLWIFYSEKGDTIMEINYFEGKKNGLRKTWSDEEIIEETFRNDLKHGVTSIYYHNKSIKRTIEFENGIENGISKEYNEEGTIITIIEYRRGFIINQEFINRTDAQGRKNGLWKKFWDNGEVRTEMTYRNDMRNGYYKEYDRNGKLLKVEKYINNQMVHDAREVSLYEIRYDYYPDGSVKVLGSYKDSVAQGIRKEFNPDGTILRSYIMANGFVVGEGLLDAKNKKQGYWKEYYESGRLHAEGEYKDDIRVGEWKFFFPNGQLEQTGTFLPDGKAHGPWKWYYNSGKPRREEAFDRGLEEGEVIEYSEKGEILVRGRYNNGLREGRWTVSVNDYIEEGTYVADIKEGMWKGFYADGTPYSEGYYVDGMPDGIHKRYWENGQLHKEGKYLMGMREGEWKYYNREGRQFLSVTYKNGIEHLYNNMLIEPELPEDTL